MSNCIVCGGEERICNKLCPACVGAPRSPCADYVIYPWGMEHAEEAGIAIVMFSMHGNSHLLDGFKSWVDDEGESCSDLTIFSVIRGYLKQEELSLKQLIESKTPQELFKIGFDLGADYVKK